MVARSKPRINSLGDGFLPRGVLEFGEFKKRKQEVFIQFDRNHLEQDTGVFDVKDAMF
jgi:hypothetical protein